MNFLSIDMRKINLAFDVTWTSGILFAHVMLLVILVFQYTAQNITNLTFFLVYLALGLVSTLLAGLSVFYHIFDRKHDTFAEKGVASALYLSDTTSTNLEKFSTRFLSHIILKLTVIVGIVLLTAIYVLAPGATRSAVPTYNPYTNQPLSESVLDEHPLFLNMFNIGAYPGMYEEGPIFFLTNIIVFLITFGIAFLFRTPALRTNIAVFLLAVMIAVTITSFLFMTAHNQSYDMDTTAKVSAYVFEWIVQTANQLTGSFVSWIPHSFHNALVVFKTQTAFAVGAATAVFVIPLQRSILHFYRSVGGILRVQFLQDWRELRRAAALRMAVSA